MGLGNLKLKNVDIKLFNVVMSLIIIVAKGIENKIIDKRIWKLFLKSNLKKIEENRYINKNIKINSKKIKLNIPITL